MKCKNNLPPDHPYFESKTEKQWRKAGRVIQKDAVGCSLHPSQMSACVTADTPVTERSTTAWKMSGLRSIVSTLCKIARCRQKPNLPSKINFVLLMHKSLPVPARSGEQGQSPLRIENTAC